MSLSLKIDDFDLELKVKLALKLHKFCFKNFIGHIQMSCVSLKTVELDLDLEGQIGLRN